MSYEIFRYIFIGGAILAGIMLIVTVFVFIFLNIPNVIGDLTGANARKAIEDIRLRNERTGEKTYRSSHINRERGKLTDKISAFGKIIKAPSQPLHGAMATEKITTRKLSINDVAPPTTLLDENVPQPVATTLLDENVPQYAATTLLDENIPRSDSTTLLDTNMQSAIETTLLSSDYPGSSGTTVLASKAPSNENVGLSNEFVIEYQITYIHTDEVIA